jgi:hypothetical protein
MQFLRSQIVSWSHDPLVWPVLLEMCEVVLGAEYPNPTLMGKRWLIQRLEDAFHRGRLLLVEDNLLQNRSTGGSGEGKDDSGQPGAAPADVPPPRASSPPEKTWFRARLLDEDGEPMAGEDYVLVDTDGVNRKGKLDAQGEVYIPPILPPGKCTITFPNIHLNPLKRK